MLARGLRAVAFACASALGITFILLSAPAQASSPVEPPSITLPNGLKVFVAEQHTSPLVQTTIWYRFGSSEETAGKTGLAHALEHMMFRGHRRSRPPDCRDTSHISAANTMLRPMKILRASTSSCRRLSSKRRCASRPIGCSTSRSHPTSGTSNAARC